MHIAFREILDRSSGLELPDFEHDQIDFWLNLAIRQFVKDRYGSKQDGFEATEKRISDLETLVKTQTISPTQYQVTSDYFTYTIDLTSLLSYTHWFTVSEQVTIAYVDCNSVTRTKRTGIFQANENTLPTLLDNPFSDHILEGETAKPLRIRRNNIVELYTSATNGSADYIVSDYHITYIKEPLTVLWTNNVATYVNCELKSETHDEVVKMAVRMAVASLDDAQKYQLQLAEQKIDVK